MFRETLLVGAVALSIYLFFKAMSVLNRLYSEGKINTGTKILLTYVSMFIPILGFLITYFYGRKLALTSRYI